MSLHTSGLSGTALLTRTFELVKARLAPNVLRSIAEKCFRPRCGGGAGRRVRADCTEYGPPKLVSGGAPALSWLTAELDVLSTPNDTPSKSGIATP